MTGVVVNSVVVKNKVVDFVVFVVDLVVVVVFTNCEVIELDLDFDWVAVVYISVYVVYVSA